MATIRYNNDGVWTAISAADIGAASDDIIARGKGLPTAPSTDTHITDDTILYINQNAYNGANTTITKKDEMGFEPPLLPEDGGTGRTSVDVFVQTDVLPALGNESNKSILKDILLDLVYPINSIYMSVNNTDPSNLFGGIWTQLKDMFLLGAGDGYTVSNAIQSTPTKDGGEATVTLSAAESGVANHTHTAGTYKGPNHRHAAGDYKGPNHRHGLYNSVVVYNNNSKGGTLSGTGGYQTNKLSQYATDYSGTGGAVTGNSGYSGTSGAITGNSGNPTTTASAAQPHNNMPPYLVVYMWKRIG